MTLEDFRNVSEMKENRAHIGHHPLVTWRYIVQRYPNRLHRWNKYPCYTLLNFRCQYYNLSPVHRWFVYLINDTWTSHQFCSIVFWFSGHGFNFGTIHAKGVAVIGNFIIVIMVVTLALVRILTNFQFYCVLHIAEWSFCIYCICFDIIIMFWKKKQQTEKKSFCMNLKPIVRNDSKGRNKFLIRISFLGTLVFVNKGTIYLQLLMYFF